MFNWVKEFFDAKGKSKVSSQEAERRVYERQKAHHRKRMEANPSSYAFHKDMLQHCDDVLASKSTKGSSTGGSGMGYIHMSQSNETTVRSTSDGGSSSPSSCYSGSSGDSCGGGSAGGTSE